MCGHSMQFTLQPGVLYRSAVEEDWLETVKLRISATDLGVENRRLDVAESVARAYWLLES